jgi:hypothetical protein
VLSASLERKRRGKMLSYAVKYRAKIKKTEKQEIV